MTSTYIRLWTYIHINVTHRMPPDAASCTSCATGDHLMWSSVGPSHSVRTPRLAGSSAALAGYAACSRSTHYSCITRRSLRCVPGTSSARGGPRGVRSRGAGPMKEGPGGRHVRVSHGRNGPTVCAFNSAGTKALSKLSNGVQRVPSAMHSRCLAHAARASLQRQGKAEDSQEPDRLAGASAAVVGGVPVDKYSPHCAQHVPQALRQKGWREGRQRRLAAATGAHQLDTRARAGSGGGRAAAPQILVLRCRRPLFRAQTLDTRACATSSAAPPQRLSRKLQ